MIEIHLVDRNKELTLLREHLGASSESNGCTVLLKGGTGTRKTRLRQEILLSATKMGFNALSRLCISRVSSYSLLLRML